MWGTTTAMSPKNKDLITIKHSLHNRTTRNGVRNCSSKARSRRQSEKNTILKHLFKGLLKGKLLTPKLRKSADKSLPQPWCSHSNNSNTIFQIQLQKTKVLRMQPRRQATLRQQLQFVLQQHPVANLHVSTSHIATEHDNNHAAIPMRSATTDSRNAKNYAHRNNHSLQNTEDETVCFSV